MDGESGIQFLFEDNHLLAAMKPSGLPSQPDSSGDASLDELAKAYLKRKYAKPGAVYLGLLHRLDRPASGVVLMARTDKAASRMSEQFRRREVTKTYRAVVEWRAGTAPEAECVHWLEPVGNYRRKQSKHGSISIERGYQFHCPRLRDPRALWAA